MSRRATDSVFLLVEPEMRDRWRAAAKEQKVTIRDFVIRAVEASLGVVSHVDGRLHSLEQRVQKLEDEMRWVEARRKSHACRVNATRTQG
jgi:uncharacterized protein YndB with AHSA1/START domain